MKRLLDRSKARSLGRVLSKLMTKIETIPDHRKQSQIGQELQFIILSIIMALLAKNQSQEDIESWIASKYTNLSDLFFCFYERYPTSNGPISQPTISRTLKILPPEYINNIVANLGKGDFQKCWLEYSKYRTELLKLNQLKKNDLRLTQSLSKQNFRVLAVDGKARKGVKSSNNQSVIDLTVYDVITGMTVYRVTIPEKKGEATVFAKFVESQEFLNLIETLKESEVIVTADAGITSRRITELLIEAGISYCLAIKGNAGNVHQVIRKMNWSKSNTISFEDKGHGRIENRTIQVLNFKNMKKMGLFHDIIADDPGETLREYRDSMLVAKVISKVSNRNDSGITGESVHCRYFLLGGKSFRDLNNETEIVAAIVRAHWKIESNHWVKDAVLKEDDCLTKTPNSSQILAGFRDIVIGFSKIFTKSTTQFIRELNNNIDKYWYDIGLGIKDEKPKLHSLESLLA